MTFQFGLRAWMDWLIDIHSTALLQRNSESSTPIGIGRLFMKFLEDFRTICQFTSIGPGQSDTYPRTHPLIASETEPIESRLSKWPHTIWQNEAEKCFFAHPTRIAGIYEIPIGGCNQHPSSESRFRFHGFLPRKILFEQLCRWARIDPFLSRSSHSGGCWSHFIQQPYLTKARRFTKSKLTVRGKQEFHFQSDRLTIQMLCFFSGEQSSSEQKLEITLDLAGWKGVKQEQRNGNVAESESRSCFCFCSHSPSSIRN
jgi:hypothetical protein